MSRRTGAPVFAAWSPDGTRLLVHAGADELTVVRAADGIATPLAVRSGSFGTPQWLDDKTVLVINYDEWGGFFERGFLGLTAWRG